MPTPSPEARSRPGVMLAVGIFLMFAGASLLLVGFVLWAGERAERLVVFPWAGRLTMLVGIGTLALGAAMAGRRAAIILSAMLVAGGLAIYAIGIVFVERLGTRLYQAGGLLTALVGLITLYSTYGMDRERPRTDEHADLLK